MTGDDRPDRHRGRLMPGRTLYYVRHGLTDWNVEQRLQGRHDIPLNADGRAQAMRCGGVLQELFAREGKSAADFGYVSSPLMRARETMELVRVGLGLPRSGYGVEPRLAEIAFGEWEGLTYADVIAREGDVISRREREKWDFLPPGGESYAQVTVRVGEWYDALDRDIVVAAHGGTARALLAHLAITTPDAATHAPIEQGVVYVFSGGTLARYA
jgi:probable phosphoglycerate mutase